MLRLRAVTRRSPGEAFIPAAGASPTVVGSGGERVRQPGGRGDPPGRETRKAASGRVTADELPKKEH